MPWGDWQFWVVTLAAAGGLWVLARQFRPARKEQSRTKLTISAKKRDSSFEMGATACPAGQAVLDRGHAHGLPKTDKPWHPWANDNYNGPCP